MKEFTCPSGCGGDVVVIRANVGDRRISLCSCSACDSRSWLAGDEVLELPRVLEHISRSSLRKPVVPKGAWQRAS